MKPNPSSGTGEHQHSNRKGFWTQTGSLYRHRAQRKAHAAATGNRHLSTFLSDSSHQRAQEMPHKVSSLSFLGPLSPFWVNEIQCQEDPKRHIELCGPRALRASSDLIPISSSATPFTQQDIYGGSNTGQVLTSKRAGFFQRRYEQSREVGKLG